MGRLPTNKRVLTEDLSGLPGDVKKGIQPLVDTVNSFMEVVYQGFNRNLSFDQNVACFIKELTYKTPSTYPVMDTISFQSELKTKAIGVLLLQAVDRSTYAPAVGPVYVPWVENSGSIFISPIQGLAADKIYTIRLLIT